MLSKNNPIQRDQLEMVALDQLVPQEHLVRKMEAALDFSFIYDLVKDVYSEIGRPSIDPVISEESSPKGNTGVCVSRETPGRNQSGSGRPWEEAYSS